MLEKPIPDPARTIRISPYNLPLCCPVPGEEGWQFHPRVFLDVSHTGEATCPYCNTRYVMTPSACPSGHHAA